MKLLLFESLALGLLSSFVKARVVNFSVIAFCDISAQLSINGQTIDLTKEVSDIPLWKGSEEVGDGDISYNYICDGKEENVKHTLAGTETNTHNELFNREKTLFTLPKFGYPNTKKWTRSLGQTELFDETYIPTFIFYGYGNFFIRGTTSHTFSKVVAILKDNVFTFNRIPSSGKNGDENKFQFKITLPDDGIYHRTVLKFRPSSYDPVFFRQILYGDIAHAIGNPAHESVTARVYTSDGTGIGLYVLQEDCTTESFIKTAFYGNEKDGTISPYTKSIIYDCSTGADFNYEDPNWLGAFQNDTYDLKEELLEMTRQIHILDINDPNQIKNLDENWLELDTLLRALALEYLAGHWDSYWFLTTNFVTYHPAEETEGTKWNYSKYKYYFIDQDFDQTWGIGMGEQLNPLEFPKKSYKDFINLDWAHLNRGDSYDSHTRVIVDKLIGCGSTDRDATCTTRTYFESHLKSIVQHIFNPVALGGRIDAYKERLRPEVIWDTEEVVRQHIGTIKLYDFKINDFDSNIESGNYLGSKVYWGLKDWIKIRAESVCAEFGFEYDKVALTPETAETYQAQDITPEKEYDTEDNSFANIDPDNKANLTSGSVTFKPSLLLSSFIVMLITILLFNH
ncbi:hypothetical protein BCR32DRAFT_271158 [Anaeromyces robustus]|uniref:Coth-domain-containing protein n=1 Tax=Anaeromyces robustus TaxID=1754192 RepID=A0A1Y1WT00_9FUNG|nr:hypothetical protein BCR32DRAFT_271158 [Anaeromyces robustus]|eukprot:ORX76657.1 hypothetical protein BCR32DRAFT_271158 [Anaeromyces robustus]